MSDQKDEYWHTDCDGGMAGPFDTIEAAQTDALEYLHEPRREVRHVRIVKTVYISNTNVAYETTWEAK